MSDKISRGLFTYFPISEIVRTSIVIPVRDEAENIEKTLRAFTRQIDFAGNPLNLEIFEILILVNNSFDNSAEIIKNFQRENPSLNLHFAEVCLSEENANIGFVRRVLMNAAYSRLKQNKKNKGVIMTTDGDTTVADDWIAANLREIEAGADAVGGRIIIPNSEQKKMNALCREIHLRDEEYRLLTAEIEWLIDDLPFDDVPRHHQHFNASFAVKIDIYEKAGGVPKVKFLEDCAFFDCLQKIDARVRHSFDIKVYTSARHVGRSEVGLSFQINQWKNLSETGEDFLVESAESIVERFQTKKSLRRIWRGFSDKEIDQSQKISFVAARIFVAPEVIIKALEKNQTFGAFYENLMRQQNGEWARKFPNVPIDKALNKLKFEIEKFRTQTFPQTSMR